MRGGSDHPERTPNHPAPDQHARPSRARAAPAQWPEPVSEWTAQYCGAVERGGTVGTDLGTDLGALAASGGPTARPQRLKTTAYRSWDTARTLRIGDSPSPPRRSMAVNCRI